MELEIGLADTGKIGCVTMKDGSIVALDDAALMRIAHAMTTLSLTPVIEHVNIEAIITSTGEQLWPGPLTPLVSTAEVKEKKGDRNG